MAWPDALRRSRPILTSANSAPGGSSFTHTMDRRSARRTIVPVPTLSSDDAFAEVKGKVDLVKVVQEHVRLTKRNKDYWGLCPFHQEDSPSFHVNPQRQSWYCFGCERKGDVFTFIELIEKTDKRGALQMLAERAGVELKKLSPEQRDRADLRKRILDLLKLSAQYYEYVLWKLPAGEPGRRVLESRHVGEETARRFQLGYAPAGRGFAEYLRAKKLPLADAQEAGRSSPCGGTQGRRPRRAPRDAHARGHRPWRQGPRRVLARGRARSASAVAGGRGQGAVRLRGRCVGARRRAQPQQPQPGRGGGRQAARVDPAISAEPARGLRRGCGTADRHLAPPSPARS